MNKFQRAALIVGGAVIAFFQVRGIADDGLGRASGWIFAFLISALLFFVGFSSQDQLRSLFSWFSRSQAPKQVMKEDIKPVASTPLEAAASLVSRKPNIGDYGIHISEMDIAIEAMNSYAKEYSLWHPLDGNGKGLRWNCCLCVYASMRYAARRTGLKVHATVWNSIKYSIENRMMEEEVNGEVRAGHSQFKVFQEDAMNDMAAIEKSVEDALMVKGPYKLEPLVTTLAFMFGVQQDGIKPLAAVILINAEKADQKIIPEQLEIFS